MFERKVKFSLKSFCIVTVMVTLLLELLSLSIYSREYIEWQSSEFKVEVVHTAAGIPHWLIYNDTRREGTIPTWSDRYVPDADDFRLGVHVDPFRLVGSLLICIILAGVIAAVSLKLQRPCHAWVYLIPPAIAVLGGMTVHMPQLRPFGLIASLAILPLVIVVVSVIGRQYTYAFMAGVVSAACAFASVRLADIFSEEHLVHDLPDMEDAIAGVIFGVLLMAIAGLSTFISQWVNKGATRSHDTSCR